MPNMRGHELHGIPKIKYYLNEYHQQIKFHKDLYTYFISEYWRLKQLNFVDTGDIPKVVHYAWFGSGKYNDTILRCMDTWQKVLPDYKFKKWTEENFPWQQYQFAREAMAKKKWGLVSDVARAHSIYYEGGIYIDTDVEILKSFDSLLHHNGFACYETNNNVSIGCFGAKKHHPFVLMMLDWYNHIHCDTDYMEIANVRTISKLIRTFYGTRLDGTMKTFCDGITIYPKEYFLPDKIDGKWCPTEKSYVIHHYTGLW